MYKVFINDRPLELTDQASELAFEYDGPEQLHAWVDDLRDGMKSSLIVRADDLKGLWEAFRSPYQEVEAAGGLVSDTDERLLMIFRNGLWDLPKGKVEEGEKSKLAAEREVKEECGLEKVKATETLAHTYHTYSLGDKQILKKTTWYGMQGNSQDELKPQEEEGITEVDWFSAAQVESNLSNTYRSIEDLVRRFWL